MIFSIQRYIEDYLNRQNIEDLDQYAVRLANLYEDKRGTASEEEFLAQMRRVRTLLFKNNSGLGRSEFEELLLKRLDKRFQKKKSPDLIAEFPGGLDPERQRLRKRRRTIRTTLTEFKKAVEARAIDSFWESRQKGQLRSKPETIGQALLGVFAKGALGGSGLALRELLCGTGFVDVAIVFGTTAHLVELKILKSAVLGHVQLGTYMATEQRREGWLVLFETRPFHKRTGIPAKLAVGAGTVKVLVIDINPIPPSKQR